MPDAPLSFNMDDPELMKNLGLPASPLSGAGQDPDEARAMMPSNGRPVGQAEMVPSRSAQSAGSAGGAGASAPMPPSQMPTAGPTDPGDVARTALTQQLTAGNKLMQTGDQMQDDPAITASEQKLAADRAAMPDPKAAQYQPSFGQRVLRGLRGAGLGLAEHGIFGAGLGAIDPGLIPGGKSYGAPNDAYDVAQGAQEKKIAGDTEQKTDLLANFARSQELLKNRESAYKEGGETFDKTTTAANATADQPNKATTANADMIKAQADAAKVALETPEAKDAAQRTLIAQRTNQANMDATLRKPGYLRSRFILTGEFQPEHDLNAADVEQGEVTKLTAAWQQQNPGKKPGFEDLQKIYQSVRGSGGAAAASAESRNLGRAASLAERYVKTLTDQKKSEFYLALTDKDPEKAAFDKQLADATTEYMTLQGELAAAGNPTMAAAPAAVAAGVPAAQSPAPVASGAPAPPSPPNNQQKMVRMRLPDGRIGRFPENKAAGARAHGAVEVPNQ